MKRVLVTGATGFIGPYVIRRLLQDGCYVIASSVHEERAREQPWFAEVEYIPFDLSHFDPSVNYYDFLGRPDNMIHLAWEGLPNYRSDFHLQVNLPRQSAFLKNLISCGLTDITVTGTCFEYGMQEGCLSEQLPAQPANPYALAKDGLRLFLQQLQKELPYSLKWVRLFYMYGTGQNPNSLFSQLDKALANGEKSFNMSGGEQIRDYLPVEKVAEYLTLIARQQKMSGIINCCSGEPVTVRQFVVDYLAKKNKTISLNLGYYPYPDYEPMRFWGDTTKLKKILT
jgi:nucleoside-diphosphate-sugar epimerase